MSGLFSSHTAARRWTRTTPVVVLAMAAVIAVRGLPAAAAAAADPASADGPAPAAVLSAATPPADVPAPAIGADGEIAALRTEASRTFLVKQGRTPVYRAALYAQPVNYRDLNGAWQKIDDTLVTAADGSLHPQASALAVQLPASLAGQPVTSGVGGSQVGLTLLGATGAAAQPAGADATYSHALPGASITWQALANGIKDTVVLDSATSARSFQYQVSMPAGATLVPEGTDGSVQVLSSTGAAIFHLAAPTVADAATGAVPAAGPVTMTASGSGSGSVLTVTVDQAWLTDPARVFPVTVDPTGTTSPTASTSTEIRSDQPNTNFGGASSVCTGGPSRGLIKFPDVGTAIPRDSLVESYALHLTGTDPSRPTGSILVYPLTQPFDPATATWNQSKTGTSWPGAGGQNAYSTTAGNYLTSWLNGALPQNGLMVLPAAGTSGACWATGTNGPYLDITYTARTGLGGGQQFYDHTIDPTLSAHVNLANGNLVVQSTELNVASAGSPLTLTDTYNSLAPMGSGYSFIGYGWTSSLFDATADAYHAVTSDGEQLPLDGTGQPAGTRVGPPSTHLTVTSPPSGYLLTGDKSQLKELVSMNYNGTNTFTDRNGNATTLSFTNDADNGEIPSSILDSQGRTYPVTSGATVGTVYAPNASGSGFYTAVSYQANADLLGVTDALNNKTTFTYDSGHRLLSATTPAGRETVFTYDAASRVTSLTQVAVPGTCTPSTPSTCPGATTLFQYYGQPTVTGGGGTTADASGTLPAPPAGTTGTTRVVDADATGINMSASPYTTTNGHYTDYTWTSSDLVLSATDANGHMRASTYGPDNNATSSSDATGTGGATGTPNKTTFGFSSGDGGWYNPTSSAAPTGATNKATYGATSGAPGYQARPTGSTDAQGTSSTYTYDSTVGNLTQVQQRSQGGQMMSTGQATYQRPASATTGTACNARPGSLCSSTTSRDGVAMATTTYTYDCAGPASCSTGQGNLVTITPPTGTGLGTSHYAYDNLSEVTDYTDGKGQRTHTSYDLDGRSTQVQLYDTSGTLQRTTAVVYDADGNPTSRADTIPNSGGGTTTSTTTYTVDTYGRTIVKTDPGATATTSCYDADHTGDYQRTATISRGGGGAPKTVPVYYTGQQYRYDPVGNLTSTCDPTGVARYGYDTVNELASFTDNGTDSNNNGHTCAGYSLTGTLPPTTAECTLFGYDANGTRTVTRFPGGVVQSAQVDNSGRTSRICALTTGTTTINPGTVAASSNPANCDATTQGLLTYDAYNYTSPTSNPNNPMSNDSQLTQTRLTAPSGAGGGTLGGATANITYTYDAMNRLTGSSSYPDAVTGTTLAGARGFNAAKPAGYWRLDDTGSTAADSSGNNLTGTTVGSTITHIPGALPGSDTAASFASNSAYTVADDARLHNNTAFTDTAWISPTFSGTVIGHGTSATTGWALTATPTTVTYQKGVLSLSYTRQASDGPAGWQQLTVTGGTGGNANVNLYIDAHLVASTATSLPTDSASSPLGLGAQGGNTAISSTGGVDEIAVYNTALAAPDISRVYFNAGRGTAYSYDQDGNRLAQNDTTTLDATAGNTTIYTAYNNADTPCWQTRTASTSCTGTAPTDARTISSDANGNLLTVLGAANGTPTSPALAFAYGVGNTVTSITPAGKAAVPQTYAGLGNGERTTSGTVTQTNGLLGVTSDTAYTSDAYDRTPDGQLLRLRTTRSGSPQTSYYLHDAQGSTLAVVDTTGTIQDQYAYDPYGNTIPATQTSSENLPQPLQYIGAYHDTTGNNATGLYKLGIRYYDPTAGRFTQHDPTGQDPLAYGYSGGDPVGSSDPTGALFGISFGDIANTVIGSLSTLASIATKSFPITAIASAVLSCAGSAVAGYLDGDHSAKSLLLDCAKGAILSVIGSAGGKIIELLARNTTLFDGVISAIGKISGGK